ncbi:hypothetical protein [Rhodopseudomonas sp. B29]|uniref:hypothetical protein n=1 Tax=Rhodopseudomonas sp. B29 TaxID=95607 RepID=UPI0003479D20|nr:hypothetical protein [Rhodopseudomonas sp. B29]
MSENGDKQETTLDPDDFPIETEHGKLKTQDGENIAEAKNEKLAEEIAERLNEHAYKEECDRWSA